MILIMADVIAFVADSIATGSTVYFILFYLILSSEMLNRTSSNM